MHHRERPFVKMNTYEVSVKVAESFGMDSGLLSSAFQRHKTISYHIERLRPLIHLKLCHLNQEI